MLKQTSSGDYVMHDVSDNHDMTTPAGRVYVANTTEYLTLFSVVFVGAVEICGKGKNLGLDDARITFTVLKHQGESKLFAISSDSDYLALAPENAEAFYDFAKEIWEEEFPGIPFPPKDGIGGYWVDWLQGLGVR